MYQVALLIIVLVFLFLLYIKVKLSRPKCQIKHSMKGKLIIVTGASSGIGKYSAIDLIQSGARVIFACRNNERVMEAISCLTEEQKELASFVKLDLSDFNSVISFSKAIKENFPKIDILMNNAGEPPQSLSLPRMELKNPLKQIILELCY